MASQDWDLLIWQRASALLRQAERIQRNFVQVAINTQYRASYGRSTSWEPPINVVETDQIVWVVAAIPGVKPDRIKVVFHDNQLIISGERPLPACCTEGELKVWEIPLGRFERRLGPFVQALELDKVSSEDGLLVVDLRKKL
jgi:HSP20 family molecular chaperone IbpA